MSGRAPGASDARADRARPYETTRGATDRALEDCKTIGCDALLRRRSVLRALRRCRGRLGAVDADGLLTVEAQERTTGVAQQVAGKPSYGLNEEDMERMLRDSLEHAKEDMLRRVLAEARVEARRSLNALDSALGKDGDLLSAAERAAIDRARARLVEAAKGEDRGAIRAAAEALEDESRPFAERRMDRGIREALAGVGIEELERGMSGGRAAEGDEEAGDTAPRATASKP